MSYHLQKRDDSVSELIANLSEVQNMSCHLLTTNMDFFVRWFDKLRKIDARATWLFLLEHKDQLTEDEIRYIEVTYGRTLEKRDLKEDV